MMNEVSVTNLSLVHNGMLPLDITETPPEGLPVWGYTLAAVTLSLIGFFGFCFNLFVIILMCRDIQIWTPMNIILFNLVCSDFSVSIIGNPFTLVSAIHHGWIFGDSICVAYGFFMSLLGITSITTLTVLSYERYCIVSCPFSAAHLTNSSAKIGVVFIWLYSFALTSPPLFGWGKYVNEAANISCSVNWETQTFNATSYIVFLFIFGLVVPLNVISYSYINIIRTMRSNALRTGLVNKIERKVSGMIFVMIAAFLIAWTPYSIFALSEQFGDPELISPSLAVLPALIAKSSICYNPLIYVGMNSQFRAAWRRVCGKPPLLKTNETTVNQLSEISTKAYMECSFINFEKKKKKKLRQMGIENKNLISLQNKQLKSGSESCQEILNNSQAVNDIKFSGPQAVRFNKSFNCSDKIREYRMFSSEANIYGKAINQIIRANSYKSNIS